VIVVILPLPIFIPELSEMRIKRMIPTGLLCNVIEEKGSATFVFLCSPVDRQRRSQRVSSDPQHVTLADGSDAQILRHSQQLLRYDS
jgi:hypothetical protein